MAETSLKILILFKFFGVPKDGVSDYLARLLEVWKKRGADVRISPKIGLSQIRDSGCDIVNLHYVPQVYSRLGFVPGISLMLAWSRLFFRKKIVISFHEVYEPIYWNRPFRWPFAILQRIQLFFFLGIAHRLIFATPVFLPRIERLFPFWKSKLECLPVFSTIPVVSAEEKDLADFRQRWGIEKKDIVLGVFSKTLHEALNLEMLFRVSKSLRDRGFFPRLFFVGAMKDSNPDYFKKLEALAERLGEKPIWTGALSPEEISKCFQGMDFFMGLWPDGASPRSTTLMTALEHGVPVVLGNSPQMKLCSGFEESVLKVDPLNEENVTQAIVEISKGESEVAQLRKRAAQFYRQSFGPEKTVERLEAIFLRGENNF